MSFTPPVGLFRVRMASTANLTLSGTQTIDGIVGAAGDPVLAKDQTTGSQNGLYIMAAGAWARVTTADNAAEMPAGSLVVVSVGTANGKKIFELTNAAGFVVGTTALVFELATNAATVALAATAPADVGTVAAVGVGTTAARADHVHDFNATDTATVTWDFTTPGTIKANSTGVALSSTNPAAVGTAAAIGVGTTAARADHVHAFAPTDTATVSWDLTTPGVIKANAVGGGSAPSPATTVTDVAGTGPSVVGTGVLYARNDHAHYHGELPGGELHDLVNQAESGLPGFMSMADYTKLQGIEDNATASFPSNTNPLAIADATPDPGADTEFSRADHVHAHGQRGAGTDVAPLHTLATNEAPGFMAATDHAALALWEIEKCRYFFLDNDAGDDAHVGFLDRTPGHSFGGGEAAAVAAAKIKTVERLLEILPRNGNGRFAKILFKNRAAGQPYLMADASTKATLDLSGIGGYRWIGRCGSTDLTNETNDMTQAGGIVATAGPNGDFSYTAAGFSGNTLTIASGSFPTDAQGAGWRVRFKGNVTPESENLCVPIYRITSSSALKVAYIGAVVAAGDEFFIERIGVTFANVYDIASATCATVIDGFGNQVELVSPMVGIQAQTTSDASFGKFRCGTTGKTTYAFCGSRDAGETAQPDIFSNPDAGHLVLSDTFVDEIGQPWPVGPCRFDAVVGIQAQTLEVAQGGLFCATNSTSRTVAFKAGNITVGHGTQFKQAFTLELTGAGPNRFGDGNDQSPIRLGATSNVGAAGLLRTGAGSLIINGVTFDTRESGTNYAFIVSGGPRGGFNVETIGSGPNVAFTTFSWAASVTDMAGIKISDCNQGRFYIDDTTITPVDSGVTGFALTAAALGTDVVNVAVEEFERNSLIDLRGNEILGSAGPVNSKCQVVINGEGGNLDAGSAVRYNGQITYPGVELAIANALNSGITGITIGDIVEDAIGFIATAGTPWSKDGGGWAAGDLIYLSADFSGTLENSSPTVGVGRYKSHAGRAFDSSRVQLNPDNVAVLADGGP
jgi:hypothetical protein